MLKKHKKVFIVVGVGIICGALAWLLQGGIIMGIFYLLSESAEIEVNTDISKYQDFIGKNAVEEYRNKWGMDESIFPQEITEQMTVKDYKMVYYNPWDAQYLSYLVVQYDADNYEDEVERLMAYPSTEYIGYYGAEGFDDEYELLAMCADSYQGFVYALTDGQDTIIYVEIIFCNYFMDIDYKEYISEKFLPIGFDATSNNPYEQKMMNRGQE